MNTRYTPTTIQAYWQALRAMLPHILLVSLLVAAAVLWLTYQLEGGHEVHFSYLISLREREASDDFRFDGYYALQATDLFAATIAKWVQTPEMIVAAYQAAGLPLETTDPRTLTRGIVAEKTAPQLVQITIRHRDESTALELAVALQRVLQQNIAHYEAEGIPAVRFRAVPTIPWVGTPELNQNVLVIAAFVFTFFIGVNAVLLWLSLGYFQSHAARVS